jgi:hypothetical protein
MMMGITDGQLRLQDRLTRHAPDRSSDPLLARAVVTARKSVGCYAVEV